MSTVIHESTYEKKYNCPYCNYRNTKHNLISHIDKKHDDMIPEGYTASRVVFNIINKKESGKCIVCGKETKWNEEKCRYDRLCGDPKCKTEYKRTTEERIKKMYGKTSRELLLDPEVQTKMLNNRKISGVYKWKDGVSTNTYCGQYELMTIKFCESFGFNPEDIITPGPVVDYVYNGEPHKWITDIYIAPYNLAIDCKDGGDNPNNRPMKEYRAKQIAKEKAIAKDGKYNYLRLTDNNFKQLLEVITLLKLQFLEDNKDERVIKINEAMFAGMAGFIPPDNIHNTYIVNYGLNNVFSNGITCDKSLNTIIIRDKDGKLKKVDKSYLDDKEYSLYKVNKEVNLIPLYNNMGKYVPRNFIYETIFNKTMYTDDQFLTEECIEEVVDIYQYLHTITKLVESNILYGDNEYYKNLNGLYEDHNGEFIMNESTKFRSSYKTTNGFSDIEKQIIMDGGI